MSWRSAACSQPASGSGGFNLTINGAMATGGDIVLSTSSESSHDLVIAGNVTTAGTGLIQLTVNDNLTINSGVTIGSRPIWRQGGAAQANLDGGNGQGVTMAGTSSIATSSSDPQAVWIKSFPGNNGTAVTTVVLIQMPPNGTVIIDGAADPSLKTAGDAEPLFVPGGAS